MTFLALIKYMTPFLFISHSLVTPGVDVMARCLIGFKKAEIKAKIMFLSNVSCEGLKLSKGHL